jgi:hypothetical protein
MRGRVMADEAEFNRQAAAEFIVEYEREVGESLRFKRTGDPFPDVILEALRAARLASSLSRWSWHSLTRSAATSIDIDRYFLQLCKINGRGTEM